ncbi:MAG: hypothetical protein IT552_00045, partial [Sphingomonadaceae bacterium]|nr:hypothetical protein [Sphingomonadaceae bacterium]
MSGTTRSKGRQRDIIDRAKVAELVASIAATTATHGQRAEVLAVLQTALRDGRAEIARRLIAHPSLGRSCANDQAFLIDQIIR